MPNLRVLAALEDLFLFEHANSPTYGVNRAKVGPLFGFNNHNRAVIRVEITYYLKHFSYSIHEFFLLFLSLSAAFGSLATIAL